MHKRYILAGLFTIAAAAFGQADPPSRVARLNFREGPVSFRPDSVDEWTAATLNFPLNTGDYLWADQGAKAEMHVGSTAIRLGETTAVSVVNLNDQLAQFSLTAGTLNVHIRYLGENENFEVDTPNVAVMLLRPGDYRIAADGDRSVTTVLVRAGDAEVTAGQSGAFNVRNGQMASLTGNDNVQQEISGAPPLDAFDGWTQSRDAREDRATISARYVPRETIGYEDLDANGQWVNVPPYGMVWRPNVALAGWAPYRNGHWAWVSPWGWTWIDDMAWGFAPFHYGRWAFAGGGWYWVPGAIAVRPVYSPALVAFVGGGGIGVGVTAWFPLGPGEVYRPAYHVSDIYVRNVNMAYVRDVTVINRVEVGNAVYVNQRVVGGVTAVRHEVFVGARPVAVAVVSVRPEMIATARVTGYTAALAPERVSVLARPMGDTVVVRTPPRAIVERTVVARNVPPPARVSFAARQQALRENAGRPLDERQLNSIRATQPERPQYVRTLGQPASQPREFGRNRPGAPAGTPNHAPPARNDRPPGAVQPHPAERSAEHPASPARPNEERTRGEQRPERKGQEKGRNARKNDRTDKQ